MVVAGHPKFGIVGRWAGLPIFGLRQLKSQQNQPMSKISTLIQTNPAEAKTKVRYRLQNWAEYNRALEKRGSITVYFSDEVIQDWYAAPAANPSRGGQHVYSDTCIETIMMFKTVFRQGYRQVRGFTLSILQLMGLCELRVPSYTQVNRRFRALPIAPFAIPPASGPLTLVIDATGVKVYGDGEWKVRQHGISKRRTWRKLHLGADEQNGFIHCHTTTLASVHDSAELIPLLDQVQQQSPEVEVTAVCLDGAYDTQECIDELLRRNIDPIVPPRRDAAPWPEKETVPDGRVYPRNQAIARIKEVGREEWKRESGYHRRSLAETAMFRYKNTFGPQLYSRKFINQQQENTMKIKALNTMTGLGMPKSVALI